MTRRSLPFVLLGALLLGACAYFNALYNANRAFDDAERASRRGEQLTASGRYEEAIEKAAKSFRSAPDGRWADDALYLIGRAHFERGDFEEARRALLHALRISGDDDLKAGARAFLGAAEIRVGSLDRGVARLDTAIARLGEGEVRHRAHLWRGRARFRLGDAEGAFADLEEAAVGPVRAAVPAELERLNRAVTTRDSSRVREAARHLISLYDARYWADSVQATVEAAAGEWAPEPLYAALEDAGSTPWPPRERHELLLLRSRLAWRVGDTARARRDVEAVVGGGAGRLPDSARVIRARWRLAEVSSIDQLAEVRSLLLPAIGRNRTARTLLDAIKRVGLLVERARSGGQSLALFLAAEKARDVLEAPRLARDLFLVYADSEPRTPWHGKALLAALDLADTPGEREEMASRLREMPDNVYVSMALASGSDGDPGVEYGLVERRLETILTGLRAQVEAEAQERDVVVQRAAAQLDSLRRQQLTDSLLALESVADSIQNRCVRLDSMLTRADSTRTRDLLNDCLRGDTLALDSLRLDSLQLLCHRLDSVSVRTEEVASLVSRCLRGDTLAADTLRADSLRREGLTIDSLFQRLDTGEVGPPPDTLQGPGLGELFG